MSFRAKVKHKIASNGFVRRLRGRGNQRLDHHASQLAQDRAQLDHHDRAIHDLFDAVRGLQDAVALLQTDNARIDLLERTMPALLNTISSSAGTFRRFERTMTGVDDQIAQLWDRLEMVRSEMLHELRYGADAAPVDRAAETIEVKIVDLAKVEAARVDGLRLNLGCGHIALDGYVNVDMRELPGVDVVAPVDDLPFSSAEVAEVFSSHVLEHFPQEQLVRNLLPYWRGLLRPGGEFRAVVPDLEAMARGLASGEIPYEDFREVTYGGQEYEGDFHFNMFSPASLREILVDAGFVDVRVEAEGRRNGKALELQIVARVPA